MMHSTIGEIPSHLTRMGIEVSEDGETWIRKDVSVFGGYKNEIMISMGLQALDA